MEYDYIHDTITGTAKAVFSTEHEVMGPWLEVEVGHDIDKMSALLLAIDNIETKPSTEIVIPGQEYSVTLNQQDVQIETNASLNGQQNLPEQLQDQQLDFDNTHRCHCGVDDFRKALLAWAKFVKK